MVKAVTASNIRRWYWIHKWSSLVCMIFLLIICLTGLPLLFSEQIDHWLDPDPPYTTVLPGTPNVNLDQLVKTSHDLFPGDIIPYIFIDDEEPQIVVSMAKSWAEANADPQKNHFIKFDAHTGRILRKSKPLNQQQGFTDIMFRLHRDLFLGLPGELFMGSMGLLFVVALVSGVVLYSPFMQKLDFGIIRRERSRFLKWLDLHNFLGIVILAWMSVVGATGVMNELSTPLFSLWEQTDVKAMLAPYQGKVPPQESELVSVQAAYDTIAKVLPNKTVTSIVYPGDRDASPHHYMMWAQGNTPLTSRLFTPALIDARTGELTKIVDMPWYLRFLEICRPLHFGDYGGMPLKIIWAIFDVITIIVLGSGIYLWLARRSVSIDLKFREALA